MRMPSFLALNCFLSIYIHRTSQLRATSSQHRVPSRIRLETSGLWCGSMGVTQLSCCPISEKKHRLVKSITIVMLSNLREKPQVSEVDNNCYEKYHAALKIACMTSIPSDILYWDHEVWLLSPHRSKYDHRI